jgi:hypothetical protein
MVTTKYNPNALPGNVKNRDVERKRPKRYFYLNGLLHKKLHINRGADVITTWCYPLKKRIQYSYADTKKNMKPAFYTSEAAAFLNRKRLTLALAISRGDLEPPQHTYKLDEHMRRHAYMWSEEDILRAHAYLTTVHKGTPRKDGNVTPERLPTEREVRAMIRQDDILYVKVGDEFKPVWQAPDFT